MYEKLGIPLARQYWFFVPHFPAYATAIKDAANIKVVAAIFRPGELSACCFDNNNTAKVA
jgi:hypothetical protein